MKRNLIIFATFILLCVLIAFAQADNIALQN